MFPSKGIINFSLAFAVKLSQTFPVIPFLIFLALETLKNTFLYNMFSK